MSLWEHVDRLYFVQDETSVNEEAEVSCQRCRITRNIDEATDW